MTSLVTGAAGFIGSHLCEALLARGDDVIAVVRRTSVAQVTRDHPNLRGCVGNERLRILALDLAGPSASSVLASLDADVWYHLAADAYVPASIDQPHVVVRTNIESTCAVLEAARCSLPTHVVILSSSEVYGGGLGPLAEDAPLLSSTPYAASKVACDRLAYSYARTFDVPVTIARPFNCYGPRHAYDAVPLFLRRALLDQPLEIFGDGLQTRDLTYVEDTVDALLRIGALDGRGDVLNIGTGNDVSVIDLAKTIVDLTGSKSEIVPRPARPGDVRKLQADSARLCRHTGWQPSVSLDEGLARNARWMCTHLGLDRA